MSARIDARGLSCPTPVVQTINMIKKGEYSIFEVIVDTGTSRDNITRLANNEGWDIEVKEESGDFVLILTKKQGTKLYKKNAQRFI